MTWVGLSLAFIVVTPMRVRPPLHSPKRLAMNLVSRCQTSPLPQELADMINAPSGVAVAADTLFSRAIMRAAENFSAEVGPRFARRVQNGVEYERGRPTKA